MGRGWGVGLGGQGGCEWRSEAFVKIKKNILFFFFGGGGGGVGFGGGEKGGWEQRSEACVKIQKKKLGGGGVRVGVVRVDVNGEVVKLL